MSKKMILSLTALSLFLGLLGLTQAVAADKPVVDFKFQPSGLNITIDGKPFASYYTPTTKIPRPYFANVMTPDGIQVTRNHPPVEGKDSMDHDTYHPGIWLTFAGINGNDYWRLKKRTEHERYLGKPQGGPGEGSFTVSNFFLDSKESTGNRIAQEICKYTIVAREGYTLLIYQSEIFSDKSDLIIGDDQEYGLGIRVQTPIEERYGGQILNADGIKGAEEAYGKTPTWCDYSGVMNGKLIGMTVMTDPANFRPSWFHTRDYGLIAANPFGREKVGGGEESKLLVKKGEKLKLGFCVAVYSADKGANVDREAMYQDYLSVIKPKAAAIPQVDVVQGNDKFDINIDGKPFTSYIYGDNLPKPSLIHIKTPSGVEVSRRHPLTELKGGTDDHLHHVGLFFVVDGVNGTKFWNNTSNSPQIKHIETKKAQSGKGKGTLETLSHWIDKKGNVVLADDRTIDFIAGENPGEYAIDYTIELTAVSEDVTFEDTEEGVFAIRLSDYLREPKKGRGPHVEPGKPIPAQSVKGTSMYFSSNGDTMANGVWGKRARWVAIQGVKDGKVVGVAILNHPESLNYPTYWHARNYGLFSANPLGQGDFQRQDDYEKNDPIYLNYKLKKGKTAYFRFKVIIYEGVKTQDQIEQRFKTFEK